MVTIRKARVQDFDAVYQFLCELQSQKFDKRKLRKLYTINLKNKMNVYLVAWDTGAVGYLSCHVQPLLHHASLIAEIQEMFVPSEKRNEGIGKMLLDELKRILAKKRIPQIEVTSRMIRTEAHRFYEKEGFSFTHKKFTYKIY
jgi:PhnO protein